MPNWCTCEMTVSARKKYVDELKDFVATADNGEKGGDYNCLDFNKLVPKPPEVAAAEYDSVGYDWEFENWGCKWGACEAQLLQHDACRALYQFDTPWEPPTKAMKTWSKRWPNLKFRCSYDDPGNDLSGTLVVHNGKATDNTTTNV